MPETINNLEDCILVGWSFKEDGTGVLVVGKQVGGRTDIVNAFQGEEAQEIVKMLTTKRKDDSNGNQTT